MEMLKRTGSIQDFWINKITTLIIYLFNINHFYLQLMEMLKRTGSIQDFWINKIKNKCCVEFANVEQENYKKLLLGKIGHNTGTSPFFLLLFFFLKIYPTVARYRLLAVKKGFF
jgi:hypothetical protein